MPAFQADDAFTGNGDFPSFRGEERQKLVRLGRLNFTNNESTGLKLFRLAPSFRIVPLSVYFFSVIAERAEHKIAVSPVFLNLDPEAPTGLHL